MIPLDLILEADNAEIFQGFAIIKKGNIVRLSKYLPEWLHKIKLQQADKMVFDKVK